MKRLLLIFVLTFVAIISVGCSDYESEEAIERGDVVLQKDVVNLDRFEKFLTNLSKDAEDNIRITAYTTEGDPIFQDLHFDGKVIQYKYDNSNDEFGGNNKGFEKDTCKEITKKENAQGQIEYFLSGCSKNDRSLFTVSKEDIESIGMRDSLGKQAASSEQPMEGMVAGITDSRILLVQGISEEEINGLTEDEIISIAEGASYFTIKKEFLNNVNVGSRVKVWYEVLDTSYPASGEGTKIEIVE